MSDTPTPDPLTALDLLRSETQVHEPTCAWVTTDQYQNCDCGTWDRFDRLVDAAVAEVRAALAAPAPEAGRLLPTFEVGQVVGDLQPGRRRHDWCSAHGDIGPAESITAHAIAAHGSTPEQIRKARKVIARAAALKGARP